MRAGPYLLVVTWNSSYYFEFRRVVQENMSFLDISYLQLRRLFCLAEQNHFFNFGKGHYGKHSCEIILNLKEMLKKSLKKINLCFFTLASILFGGAK